jgi:hypothetical protein
MKDIEVPAAEVSDQFSVTVRILKANEQMSGEIQVGINDKIQNIKEMIPMGGGSGGAMQVLYKGGMVKGEDTYFKKRVT